MMTSVWGLGQPGDRDIFTGGNHRYAMWDAAYALGSLSAGDRREFEMHMADCPACRPAVVEISGIPAMLSQVDGNYIAALNGSGHASEVPAKSSELLPSLLATVRWRRRRTRLITWTVATAVAIVLTIAVVLGIQGRFPTSPPPQTTVSALPMAQAGTTGRDLGWRKRHKSGSRADPIPKHLVIGFFGSTSTPAAGGLNPASDAIITALPVTPRIRVPHVGRHPAEVGLGGRAARTQLWS